MNHERKSLEIKGGRLGLNLFCTIPVCDKICLPYKSSRKLWSLRNLEEWYKLIIQKQWDQGDNILKKHGWFGFGVFFQVGVCVCSCCPSSGFNYTFTVQIQLTHRVEVFPFIVLMCINRCLSQDSTPSFTKSHYLYTCHTYIQLPNTYSLFS